MYFSDIYFILSKSYGPPSVYSNFLSKIPREYSSLKFLKFNLDFYVIKFGVEDVCNCLGVNLGSGGSL